MQLEVSTSIYDTSILKFLLGIISFFVILKEIKICQ
jgi:hypothetical protein